MRWACTFCFPLLLLSLPAASQEVVSAYSGTVHFFEGAVLLDDQPLDHRPATFPSIKEGSILRTERGRAEVLLTPGVVFRIDEDSAFRLVFNALTDTRLEFLHGSAIIDSMEASGTPPVTVSYQHCQIRFPKPGIYRIDSDTGVLQAYSGQVQVTTAEGKSTNVDTARLYFFELGALTNKFGEPNEDEFYDWARGRADAISAENQLASQSGGDSGDNGSSLGVFTAPLPSYGTYPAYPGIDSYTFGSPFFDPYFGFTAGAFAPYNVFPIFLVVRPRRTGTAPWPHRNPTTLSSGYVASHPGLIRPPIRTPVFTPRPASGVIGGSRAYRPAPAAAPHPTLPAGVRAIHH